VILGHLGWYEVSSVGQC